MVKQEAKRGGCPLAVVTHILVNDALDLHGLHDISNELGVCVCISDLLMKQCTNAALKDTRLS